MEAEEFGGLGNAPFVIKPQGGCNFAEIRGFCDWVCVPPCMNLYPDKILFAFIFASFVNSWFMCNPRSWTDLDPWSCGASTDGAGSGMLGGGTDHTQQTSGAVLASDSGKKGGKAGGDGEAENGLTIRSSGHGQPLGWSLRLPLDLLDKQI